MHGASVLRSDGTRGTVVGRKEPGQVVVEFGDGSRIAVAADALVRRSDGAYELGSHVSSRPVEDSNEVVIPVIAEELSVQTHKVARGRVRVHKRVETREETVEVPTVHEDIVVEHVPINKVVEGAAPEVRDEDGVLVIPVIEEVVVVDKQLVVREEVRVFKRRTTRSTAQTVVLRREVIDVEREELDGTELPAGAEVARERKEQLP
jgi:uncharacterized protein (TIGR02271 family)